MNRNQQSLVVFIHVGRCAGTTLKNHIKRSHPDSRYLDFATPEFEHGEAVQEHITELSDTERSEVRFLMGHHTYYGIDDLFERDAQYVTILRDPVDRCISHYNYVINHRSRAAQREQEIRTADGRIVDFYDWIASDPPLTDYMTWFLAQRQDGAGALHDFEYEPTEADLEAVTSLLDAMTFVGLVEQVDRDMPWLFDLFDVQSVLDRKHNRADPAFVPDDRDDVASHVLKHNPLDAELYQRAQRIRDSKIAEIPEFDETVRKVRRRRQVARILPGNLYRRLREVLPAGP